MTLWQVLTQDVNLNNNFKSKFILVWFRLSQIIYRYHISKIVLFPLLVLYRIIIEWFMGTELHWKLQVGKLRLFHGQSLIINPATILGDYCTLRCNTVIGNKGYSSACPIIGNNVDIGANCVIIGSIKIGNNVIIGAGSVVVKDVPDNSIIAGNPAKIIKIQDANKHV